MNEYYLFSDIVDFEVKSFAEFAKNINGSLKIYITSYGGDVFSGMAMVSIIGELRRRGVHIEADIVGICASAATLVALACDYITMRTNAVMMFHSAYGPDNDIVDRINAYQKDMIGRRLKDGKKVNSLITKKDTYLSALECYQLGLCDRIDDAYGVDAKAAMVAARAKIGGYRMEEEKTVEIERETERGDVDIMALIEEMTRKLEDHEKRLAALEGEDRREKIDENIEDVIEARAKNVYARLLKITSPVSRTNAKKDVKDAQKKDLDRAKAIYGDMRLPD